MRLLLKNEHGRKTWTPYIATDRFFDWILSLYRRSLHWVLENPVLALTVLLLTIALNVAIVIKIPKGFFPLQDTGSLGGGIHGPQDSSFPAMNDSIQQILKVIKNDPAVAERRSRLPGGGGATNTGNHVHGAEAAERSERSALRT